MSHPGSRGFWRMIDDVETHVPKIMDAWHVGTWQELADAAHYVATVCQEIAKEALEMAEREKPPESPPTR
jgi:hypothetical protein